MKNKLVLLFMIITAAVLGGLLGNLCDGVYGLSWLAYSKAIGLDATTLNLSVFDLTFGIHVQMNVAQIILLALALVVSPKIANAIKT
ncbi:DUF4321 domain-containing protein [Ruminococcus sp.]|uniref:DUF4321 domain-containing protein n=1 Tax=Ruminococcus sp. TaxID=41978 RepID=UPI0025EC5179|nr:DUF4321 domain-containing protein [Ruminococcus sp.]MCI5815478.1 DUF4321 domain-containing protein [Ruminococcus sp.]MDD7557046.1 DUF4321 domain-containing protein [Ruminococcus sp.]MDY4964203.1 DUF4321 domain-containing protein [Ruminococcus callidus]